MDSFIMSQQLLDSYQTLTLDSLSAIRLCERLHMKSLINYNAKITLYIYFDSSEFFSLTICRTGGA